MKDLLEARPRHRTPDALAARRASLFPLLLGVLAALAGGCNDEPPPTEYQTARIERRDLVVSAEAAGVVEPEVTVEVKSKASGEILEMRVDTGDRVERGTPLIRIDARQPRNRVAQAEAELEVARARLANAESQLERAERLFRANSMSEADHDAAVLDRANAHAEVVRAQIALENARIELGDTEIHAPISGSIISKNVERGQVISSATNVSGGTVLLHMADLARVRVRTLVDETDIGKVSPGDSATVVADAYPDLPFAGTVVKIEPQAVTEQSVTTFPVLVRVDNPEGALRPGMNADVEIHIGVSEQALTVPNAALRDERDVQSAAELLGLSPERVQADLAESGAAPQAPPAGRRFVVFVDAPERARARLVRAGLTDLDASEILSGLEEGERVFLLPSSGLLRSQQEYLDRVTRVRGNLLSGVRKGDGKSDAKAKSEPGR